MAADIARPDRAGIEKALAVLKRGGVIVYPTETSYGIGADATNDKAVLRVARMKKRQQKKRISIAVCDTRMARRYLIISREAEKLCTAFMPGPLTLVVPGRKGGTVGFRIPGNSFARRLIMKFGKPITATSANISGRPPLYNTGKVKKIFSEKADLIIDAGDLERRKPSTVLDVQSMTVLRKGPVSREMLAAFVSQRHGYISETKGTQHPKGC